MTKQEQAELQNKISRINTMPIRDIQDLREAVWILSDVCSSLISEQSKNQKISI